MSFGSDKLWPTPSECDLLAPTNASEQQGPFSSRITSRDLQFRQEQFDQSFHSNGTLLDFNSWLPVPESSTPNSFIPLPASQSGSYMDLDFDLNTILSVSMIPVPSFG
jgi:hypothetical protein